MPKTYAFSFLLLLSACRHVMPVAPPTTKAVAAAPRAKALSRPRPPCPCLAEIAEAEKATTARPDDPQAWSQLSVAYAHANRIQEAARVAWRAVELGPGEESWTALGNVFIQGGAPSGALAAFEEVSRQTNDSFLAAQNFINLGAHAWRWGMDDLAIRSYARAEELAPGHPQIGYYRILMLAAAGKVSEAQAEATKLRNVVDRVLMDRPPLEMVEILEPMKALVESVMSGEAISRLPPLPLAGQQLPDYLWRRQPDLGRALDLNIQPSSTRLYPIAGWQTLAITVPSEWVDTFETGKEQPAQIVFETQGPSPTLWILTVRVVENPDLDRLLAEERSALARLANVGAVRPLTSPQAQGRGFVADTGASGSAQDYSRLYVVVMQAGHLLVNAKIYLQPGDLSPVEQADRILCTLQNRDLTPPRP